MWFWINFSPIGEAPPAPKKASDLPTTENKDIKPETKLDGELVF